MKLRPTIIAASMALTSLAMAEAPTILQDKAFYTKGSWIAYAAPWSIDVKGSAALQRGVDYADEIAVQPETFPAHSEFSWHWPLTPPKHVGVYGYNALSFGTYDGGVPQTPITPRQVKAIETLSESFRIALPRSIGDFNVLTEFFLAKNESGEPKLGEVGFFPHAAKTAIPFADAGEQLGVFTDATGRAWKVGKQSAPQGPYFMFIPTGDVIEGTIDFKGALDFLRAKGQLTGDEWFTGLAFGIEPVAGSGSLRVEHLSVIYK